MMLPMLPTPAVLVERSRLFANLDRMQAAANTSGIRLRPHTKTHKSPRIAAWQLERGAVGICCAKLGEAEVMAEAGIPDIRIPYPLYPTNAARVLALLPRTRLSFIVDSLIVARGWSVAMHAAEREVEVLIKVDVGFHRCGIDPDVSTALPFIRAIATLPGLRLAGLLAHAGQGYHAASPEQLQRIASQEATALGALAEAARHEGIEIREVSAGATPTARYSLLEPGLTEFRPGNYAYLDRTQVGLGAAGLDDCALTVLATVVSKPAPDRLILDCGSKTLSSDVARGFTPIAGYGDIYRDPGPSAGESPDPDLLIERLSEEHATVRALSGSTPLVVGERVRVLPNHACVVSNLVDEVWLTEGGQIMEALPIVARGKIA